MNKIINNEIIAPYFAVMWLMFVMNTIIAWYSFSLLFLLVGAFGVFFCSARMKRRMITKGRQTMCVLIILYMIWDIIIHNSIYGVFISFFTFSPLICVLFWPLSELKKTYELFRKIVLFFAIGSSVIIILYYLGLLSMIPHYELPPHSQLHSNRGDIYEIYVIFPQLVDDDFLRRACGMSLEAGHFSIVLGFIYLVDRYIHRRINPIIVLCAILAFSPAFFLIVLFVESVNIRNNYKKILLLVPMILFIVSIVYSFLPRDIQDTISFLAYERNVEKLVGSYNESGNLEETLDERTNQYGKNVYDKMDFGQKLVGGEFDNDVVLSDYRGFILTKGLISMVLVALISLFSLSGAPLGLKVSLFFTLFMIMLHRAWFFYEPFPYLMSFIASSLCSSDKLSLLDKELLIVKKKSWI